MFLNIHQSGVLTAPAWLVPHEIAAVSACSVYSSNHSSCHFIQSHVPKVHVYLAITCHLHFWQNDWGLFTYYCGNTGFYLICNLNKLGNYEFVNHSILTNITIALNGVMMSLNYISFRQAMQRLTCDEWVITVGNRSSQWELYSHDRSPTRHNTRHSHCQSEQLDLASHNRLLTKQTTDHMSTHLIILKS